MSITKEFDTITAISTPFRWRCYWYCSPIWNRCYLLLLQSFQRKKSRIGCFTYYQLRPYRRKMMKPLMKSWSVLCVRQRPLRVRDVVEINTHGGLLWPMKFFNFLIRSGARMAEPGEFTKRAFWMVVWTWPRPKLLWIWFVLRLIRLWPVAVSQLDGSLQDLINNTRQEILNTLAQVEGILITQSMMMLKKLPQLLSVKNARVPGTSRKSSCYC